MDKVLKLYNYVDGVNDTPFPSSEDQAIITSFQYDSKRMGSAPTISATLMHEKCLDKLWTYKVYATFNGEKYFIKQIPSSSYSNAEILYKHEIDLVSERVVLDNVYVYDAVSSEAVYDRPVSNSTKFTFFGDIHEFAQRLNYSLEYRHIDYSVVVDDGISSEGKMVSFEDTVFSNAIQESYNTYEIPYYFVGKVIHFGFTDNAITETFKYGAQNSLLSIQKNNANYKVVTRITGTGSSDNVPYYYPNDTEKGEVTILYNGVESENVSLQDEYKFANFKLEDKLQFKSVESREVELISSYNVNNYVVIAGKDEEKMLEFDVETRITIPSYDNIELKLSVFDNIDTSVYFNDTKKGETQFYSSFISNEATINVKISSDTYILLVTSRVYLKDSTEINTLEEADRYVRSIFNISAKYTYQESNFWSKNDLVIFLSDYGIALKDGFEPTDGDYITLRQDKYIQPSDKLLPPIYRETDGKERFYEAINNTYISPQTGLYYVFNNEFVENNPKEHIVSFENIKPTIKGMTNAAGLRIDMFTEFAYDLNDNDDTYSDASDKAGEYIHPYFFAKLRKFDGEYGFNLFDHAIDEAEMTISMTSGNCGACEWTIGVDENTQKNIVQVDENGNLLRDEDGNVLLGAPQDRQNDTKNYEVWIALKKDINTFGVIMPNVSSNYKPASGDTFVILHIDLPKSYILSAENRLKEELIKYMAANNDEKFNFSISFSRIYFAENPDMLASLNENARLQIEYDGETYELYVSSYSYKMSNDSPLPDISVELSDTLTVSQNAMQNAIDKVEEDIMRNVGSIDWLKLGLAYFIRKDKDDSTQGSLTVGKSLQVNKDLNVNGDATIKSSLYVWGVGTFRKMLSAIGGLLVRGFIKIGDFISGLQGGYIDEQGNAELESLILRSYLAVPELRYNRITFFEGYNVISPGGGLTIDDYVINDDGTITVTPRLEDGEPCGQFVDDILLGYWHSKTASGDFAGFAKVQFRVVSVDYDAKTFVMLPNPDLELHIEKNMKLAQTGNFTNTERQTYIVIDTRYGNNCITLYDGVNTWTPTAAMAKAWFGKKKGVDIHGIDASTYSAVLQNIIMTGKIYQVDQISGQDIPVPIDKGAWVNGQRYAYYDRVTYNGSLWLCVNENGTTTEPSSAESSWLEQVAAGKGITSYAHWSTSICPVPANTILTFAQRLWISVRETSEPPLGCVTSQGAYVTYKDSEGNTGYVLRNPQTQSEDWVLLLDVSEMKDGDSIQVQYSADTTSWHTTFTEGDLYMRQRVGEASWSAAMRIVGESGQEGRHTEYQFTKNKSEYTQPTTGWQDAPPSLAEGEYLWMRTGVVIPPATAPATWAVVRLSGEKGDAGVGVSSVKEYYLASASSSGVTTSTSGWTETPQSVSESKPYLWNYETISYTDSKTVTIDPHIIGRWGANGKNGVGIASVVNQYAKSNSGTETPSVWYTTPPAIDSTSRFLWNKETITYTDGSHIDVPAHVIGVYGEKGADGADGIGITNYGHWSSSLGKLPALSMVTMGGKSWLSKVSTANPPMGTVMSGGQRVKTKDASGQSVYVLSGLVNTSEWELVTESGRVFTLVPTVGSVVQTKLGFLSPSAFLVNVNQTVGSVSMPYSKGWVVARAMDYNGAMVQVVSASQTSQISITAYGSYTQYVVRLYSSYANARNWQGDFMAEATIPVIADGVDGKDGRTGSEPRPRGQWVSGNTYVYNEKFRDIVVYNGHIYRVRSYGASVTAAPTGSDSDTNWEGADEMKFVATDLLLAQDVYTDKLTVTKVNAKSSDGKTTCKVDGETGKLTAKKAEFDGVTSNNMTATNMTVDGITATNANISGKITATSGKVAGFSISGDGLTNEGFNNDAYLIFRNDTNKCFAGIGGNVLPATSGARAVARFENHDTGDQWGLGANYGALVSAQGARTNVALHIDGGSVCGFAYKNLVVNSSGTLTLGRYDNNIIAINTAELTLTLPSMKLYDDGHSIRIKRLGTGALKIKVGSCSTYNSDGSERTSSPCLIYDENVTLIPGDTLSFNSICDSMELVWVRDNNRTYNNVTYYGCWVQYKIPRAW